MENLLNLPLLLTVAFFIGMVILVRLLLAPEHYQERRSESDRRKGAPMPALPFYDADNNLVMQDRRRAQVADRRNRVFIITSEQRRVH